MNLPGSTHEHLYEYPMDNSMQQILFPSEESIRDYLIQDQNNELNHQHELTNLTNFTPIQTDLNIQSNEQLNYWVNNQDYNHNHCLQWINHGNPHILKESQNFLYNQGYFELRFNGPLLVTFGYKLALTLNIENSIDENWNPKVAQTLLSVQYSPLNLRSEVLSRQIFLDQFESLAIEEANEAFNVQFLVQQNIFFPDQIPSNPTPVQLVTICQKVKGFRRLFNGDKIILLSNVFYDTNSISGVINYNQSIDGWSIPEINYKCERIDVFLYDKSLHNQFAQLIETFPHRWRNDQKVVSLIYLITIFNPDLQGLRFADSIRYEQYIYVYLLGRYLRSVCGSNCEANDNHYRIMVKIEESKGLSNTLYQIYDKISIGFSSNLYNCFTRMINNSTC